MVAKNKTDLFSLCRAKIINTTLALRSTKYLSKERDYIPWESALRNLEYFILMFDRTEVYGALQVSKTNTDCSDVNRRSVEIDFFFLSSLVISKHTWPVFFFFVFLHQAYLRKQIQPLFDYFRTITANWTRIPSGQPDQ